MIEDKLEQEELGCIDGCQLGMCRNLKLNDLVWEWGAILSVY